MIENMTNSTSVMTAFELLVEELGRSLEVAREAAAKAVKAGDYELGETFVEEAKDIERIMMELTALHDKWAENHDHHSETVTETDNEYSGPELTMTYMNSSARAFYNKGRVVVLAGSTIMSDTFPSLPSRYLELRKTFLEQGKLKSSDVDTLRLSEDIQFNSQSGAAQFVAGCSVSGNRDWRIKKSGETLGFWLKKSR